MKIYILLIQVLFLFSCENSNNILEKKEKVISKIVDKKDNKKIIENEKKNIILNVNKNNNDKNLLEIKKEGKKLDDLYISYFSFEKVNCGNVFNIEMFPNNKEKVLLYNWYCKKEKKEALNIKEKNNKFTLDKCKWNNICEIWFVLKQNNCNLLENQEQRNKCEGFKKLNKEKIELEKVNNFRVEDYLN